MIYLLSFSLHSCHPDRHGKVWPILASGTSDNLWYLDVHHIPPTRYGSLHIHGIWMYLHDIWVRLDTLDIIDILQYLFLSHFSDLSYLDIWHGLVNDPF